MYVMRLVVTGKQHTANNTLWKENDFCKTLLRAYYQIDILVHNSNKNV